MKLRKMRPADVDEVFSLQKVVYDSSHIEPRQTFLSHIDSSSSMCVVLETAASSIVGYVIAHPSEMDAIDRLSSASITYCKNPSVLYIHDVCLHPHFRGYGYALAMLKFIADKDHFKNLDHLALVSIKSALKFWLSLGFRPRSGTFCESMNSYGLGSMYLVCKKVTLLNNLRLSSNVKQLHMNNINKYNFPLKILFDESHSESWSISEDVAKQIQPQKYSNSSYAAAATAMVDAGFTVDAVRESGRLIEDLSAFDVLVIVHPCDADYESTVPIGTPVFSDNEVNAIQSFVKNGGGLIVISEYDHKKYGSNLNQIIEKFGLKFQNRTISEEVSSGTVHATWITPLVAEPAKCFGLTSGVSCLCFYRSTVCSFNENSLVVAWPFSIPVGKFEGSIVCSKYEKGKVLAIGDSDLFGDVYFHSFDHRNMWLNMAWWIGSNKLKMNSSIAIEYCKSESQFAKEIVELVDKLRACQYGHRGCVQEAKTEAAKLIIEDIVSKLKNAALSQSTKNFGHQLDYFLALTADFESWRNAGLHTDPDFGESFLKLKLQDKRGLNQTALVVAPMYLQNASTDYRFEAVYLEIPWPLWLKHIEENNPDPTYIPGRLLKYSSGYASNCAVLFPEQVLSKKKLSDVVGVIFCDREAERLIRYAEFAAAHFNITFPPDLIACMQSKALIEDAFMLWDLMHNLSHFEGPLPYHRFKSGKKQPYWMYALEELKVDISAYSKIIANDKNNGLNSIAKYVIVLDRVFRFSISGDRERNYDALAGQILLSFLQSKSVANINTTDSQAAKPGIEKNSTYISLSWQNIEQRILQFKGVLDAHETEGANSSLEEYWLKSYYLVATLLTPALTSKFPRTYDELLKFPDKTTLSKDGIRDRVVSDEFPLNQMLLEYKAAATQAL